MSYEPTSPTNPQRLTVKQHFHMKAILKRFDGPHGIKVTNKVDGIVSYHEADDGIFLSRRAWSQEAEADISHPIEEQFDREVKRIESQGMVVKHDAVSRYHLLWTLRYRFAKDPIPEQAIFPTGIGSDLPGDLEEWAEAHRKVPIRKGGNIAGRFITSVHLRQDLLDPRNQKNYEDIVWNLMRSDSTALISADCYGDCLLMVISPRFALIGSRRSQELNILSSAEAELLNGESVRRAQEFTFG
ncbi:hypothetical protein [Pseudomonas syringae]|uniref:hypothetical protein n=1 Tax=Pseudomonas syringae TaxID=317 RepID=UPI00114578C7|nr:hypothetical protein [Pseudomonas syringae]